MNNQDSSRTDLDHSITRRRFIGTTALSSAALLSGGLASLVQRSAFAAGGFDFAEKSIPELQDAMAASQLTSRELTHGYIRRIQSLKPLLHSGIEAKPNSIEIAPQPTNGWRRGRAARP